MSYGRFQHRMDPNNMSNNKVDEDKSEAKEHDKCMENNDHEKDPELAPKSSKLDAIRGRAKKLVSNRHHLIILLLCIIVFILFIIVIALSVQLGNYVCSEGPECKTFECLRSASSVAERADLTVDPCHDFWSFSCKGWKARNPLPNNRGSFSVIDQTRDRIRSRLRHLIDLVPYNADPASYEWKVKSFYSSCVSLKEIEYWVPQKLKQAINEIGGWALINNPPGGHWSRNDVLKKLHVTFGVSAFFKVIVEADDTNPIRNIIKLVPGGLGLPSHHYYFKPHDNVYVRAYKEFMKNTVQQMEVTLHEANKFAEEVFNYEKRIAEITPSSETLRNTKELYEVLTVNELDKLSTSISWTDLLQTYFPGMIQPNTEVAILSPKYFSGISRVISSTDNSVLNNYYMWRFVSSYVHHSSSSFRVVVNHLQQTLEGVSDLNLKYEDTWESCLDVTSHFLGHAMGAMYVNKYFPHESQEQIQLYLHKLVGALSGVTNGLSWLNDGETRDNAQSKVRSLLLLIGHPGFAKNRTLETYYKELRVQTDYFQNIKDGVYFLHKKQEEMLSKKAVPDYSWTIYSHNLFAEYKYSGNQLVVPAGLFEYPLFDIGAPLAVKYGTLGAHVANKLSEALDDKGSYYDPYGTLNPWMSNSSMMSFKRKEECLKTAIANVSFESVLVRPDITIASVIDDIGGVKIAYEAYQRHARELNDKRQLPGININNDKLFFISYAQSLCQIIRPEKLRAIRDSSTTLPNALRMSIALQESEEFSKAFSCLRGSTMNPYQKCYVW